MIELPVSELLDRLMPDLWRKDRGFSVDIAEVHQRVFGEHLSDDEIAGILNGWIAKYQPCLFGRIAARLGLIRFCVLSDDDLKNSDTFIREKIQSARLSWLQAAITGDSSAFMIAAVSKRVSLSLPDEILLRLASRLGSLYLLKELATDKIYLDSLELEVPGKKGKRLRWDVGVNFFSSQADLRWWHDHRMPCGLAFSMNSVGHLVLAGKVAGAMQQFEQSIPGTKEEWRQPSIQDLNTALIYAIERLLAPRQRCLAGRRS